MRRDYRKTGGDTPLPEGYQKLEYIESTGNQYIRTGVTLAPDLVWDIDFQYTSLYAGDKNMFGAENYSYVYCRIYCRTNLTPNRLGVLFTDNQHINAVWVESGYTDRHVWHIQAGDIRLDGVQLQNDNVVGKYSSEDITLFAINRSGTISDYSNARLYYTELKNGNVHKILVPALRLSDSKPGLYDTVNDVFYTNAGSGEFNYA